MLREKQYAESVVNLVRGPGRPMTQPKLLYRVCTQKFRIWGFLKVWKKLVLLLLVFWHFYFGMGYFAPPPPPTQQFPKIWHMAVCISVGCQFCAFCPNIVENWKMIFLVFQNYEMGTQKTHVVVYRKTYAKPEVETHKWAINNRMELIRK